MLPLAFEAVADKEDYLDMRKSTYMLMSARSKIIRRNPVRAYLMMTIVYLLLFFLLLLRPIKSSGVLQVILLALVAVGLLMLLLIWGGYAANISNGAKIYKMAVEQNDTTSEITVASEGLSTASRGGNGAVYYRWNMLSKLLIGDRVFVFVMQNGIAIFFGRRFLPVPENEFLQAIAPYMEGKPVIRKDA